MSIQFNGDTYDEDTFETAVDFLSNEHGVRPQVRPNVAQRMGSQYDGDRDVAEVLGYPDEITLDDYRAKYERGDIAERIVKLPATDTWRKPPEVYDDEEDAETEFAEAVVRLNQRTQLWNSLKRTDVIAGIGEFGVMFIGFADGGDISDPVNKGSINGTDDVEFYQPFAQDSVETWRLGKNEGLEPADERYNLPVKYRINFGDVDDQDETDNRWVHWTRILHIPSDGRDENEIKGAPRLRAVYNRLLDLEKTVGASAEMFWAGADRKMQFDVATDDTSGISDEELARLDDEVQSLVHEMQHYIKTFNTDIEVIGGDEVDPSGVVDEILKFVAGTTGIPKRILTGSERGELASTQDRATWYGRVDMRRKSFIEPIVIRVLFNRFIDIGVLPKPLGGTYEVSWANLFELNDIERSEVQENRAAVLETLAPQGNTDLLADFDELMDYIVHGDKPDLEVKEMPELDESNEQVQEQFANAFTNGS